VRRLPLLVVAAIGLFFLLPQAPREVELDYDFGTYGRGATRVEIEIRDARGVGVRRTERKLAPGTTREVQHLRLERGAYRVTLTFTSSAGSEKAERDFSVRDEEVIEVKL
jgi:hypothetical protein